MAQVDAQHVPVLTSAFVGILVVSLLLLGTMNFLADK